MWYYGLVVPGHRATITPGTLMLFYSLVGYVISPIGSIITSNQTIQDALIAADRLFQIMDLEVEEESMLCFDLEPDMINGIVFEDVYFRYGSRKQVFEKLNLKIETGKTTAIVGEKWVGQNKHWYPCCGISISDHKMEKYVSIIR